MGTGNLALKSFSFLEHYQIQFSRIGELFFYQIQDINTQVIVDFKDNLTKGQFLDCVGVALEPAQEREFQDLVNSL